jgi:hypothetical protein
MSTRTVAPAARLYQARSNQVRKALAQMAVRQFNAMPDWSDPDALAVPMAQLSTAAQVTQAELLTSMVSIMNGERVDLPVAEVTGNLVRDGDLVGSWRIPIFNLYSNMADGLLNQDGLISAAHDDVQVQATTDLALSQRMAMTQLGQNTDQIVGYWRVPEGGSSCDFCNLIADQMYHIEDLMPVHPNCSCSVEPAFASEGDSGSADEGD